MAKSDQNLQRNSLKPAAMKEHPGPTKCSMKFCCTLEYYQQVAVHISTRHGVGFKQNKQADVLSFSCFSNDFCYATRLHSTATKPTVGTGTGQPLTLALVRSMRVSLCTTSSMEKEKCDLVCTAIPTCRRFLSKLF